MIGDQKTCTKCLQELPLSSFRKKLDKLTSQCADCLRCGQKQRYAEKRQEINAKRRAEYQSDADVREQKRRQAREWRKNNPEKARLKDKRSAANRDPEYLKEWKLQNQDKVVGYRTSEAARTYSRKYRQENRVLINSLGARRRSRCVSEYDSSCYQIASCCQACGSLDQLHIDHKVPLASGGKDKEGNLQTLCGKCNMSKGALTITEWKYSGRPRAREVFPGLWEKRQALRKSRPHVA